MQDLRQHCLHVKIHGGEECRKFFCSGTAGGKSVDPVKLFLLDPPLPGQIRAVVDPDGPVSQEAMQIT